MQSNTINEQATSKENKVGHDINVNLSRDYASFVPTEPIRVVRSVARLTQKPRSRARYPVRLHTFVSTSAVPSRAVVSYW